MRALILAILLAAPASAQAPASPAQAQRALWEPAARTAAQQEAMRGLAFLDGAWRGSAVTSEGVKLVQTERVGTLLDGTVRLVEGRGYDSAGKTRFNALGVISYDPLLRTYSMRAHASGYVGDFPLTVRPDGFSWSQPGAPGVTIRYTATVTNGEWHEIGERIAGKEAPVKMVEMRLKRIGPTGWPEGEAVPRR